MKVLRQRPIYLENLKKKTRRFCKEIVKLYNQGVPTDEIASKYINPRTGEKYSRQHIYFILNKMQKEHLESDK